MPRKSSKETPYKTLGGRKRIEAEYLDVAKPQIFECSTDRARAVLNENLTKIKSRQSWVNPFGVLLTVLIVLNTIENYKKSFGISAEVWEAFFLLLLIVSLVWLVVTIILALRYRDVNTDNIIKQLRGK